jgi:hypothetical protein
LRWCILDFNEFQLENQSAVGCDFRAFALLAVGKVGGQVEFPFGTDRHGGESFLETFHHLQCHRDRLALG